jgi:hypothetical protein
MTAMIGDRGEFRSFSSYWIRNVNKAVLQAKIVGQVIPEGFNAVAFGRMMAACQVSNARLPGKMHGRLGNFTTQIRACPGLYGVIEHVLCGAGAPRHRIQRMAGVTDDKRRPAEAAFDQQGQIAHGTHARRRLPQPAQVVFPESPGWRKAKAHSKLRVVAPFRMGIERQVKGKQTDVPRQQQLETLLLGPDHAGIFSSPEIPMVNQDGVRAGIGRCLQKCEAGSDAGNDRFDCAASFDLHTVWAIIAKTVNIERLRQISGKVISVYHCC